MKPVLLVFALVALVFLPLQTNAQTKGGHGEHGGMAAPAAAAPAMPGGGHSASIMLGETAEQGVKAMAHLNDVGAMMAKMGKKENYHFMVMFADAASGAAISGGTVALRITSPGQEKAGETIALMGMGGHFGADVSLTAKGEYAFTVGSMLADGTKREFQFKYMMK
jgi:hypothetical protein